MEVKKICNMGEIVFDEFYTPNNIIISNMNMSPIKDSKNIDIINEQELKKLINNEYIYSLLNKRNEYYLYECIPEKLISHYRYDVYVKYFYVKNYIENNNYKLARKIYLSHIEAFNNYMEPDGSKKNKKDFIDGFNKLIDSIRKKGFSETIIPISKTGIPIDGSHRLAICLYFNIKVSFVVFDLLDGKYDKDFFCERGMNKNYIKIIDDLVKNKGWI